MDATRLTLGLDLGGTKIACGLVSERGEVMARHRVPTGAERGPEAVIDTLVDAAQAVCAAGGVGLAELHGVGVGAPGPVDVSGGRVVEPPNLPGWRDVPLRDQLAARLGRPVTLDNDANAAGLGEARFGAGRGASPLIYLTVSTGIGGAILIDDRLVHGAAGAAGELGHLVLLPGGPRCGCGGHGCLEALASGTAIAREAAARMAPRKEPWTAEDVAALAAQGDSEAGAILDEAMRYLGLGVAGLVNALNPARVVIGGGLTALGDRLFQPVRRAIDEHANPVAARSVTVVPAALGADVGIIGAAALALPG